MPEPTDPAVATEDIGAQGPAVAGQEALRQSKMSDEDFLAGLSNFVANQITSPTPAIRPTPNMRYVATKPTLFGGSETLIPPRSQWPKMGPVGVGEEDTTWSEKLPLVEPAAEYARAIRLKRSTARVMQAISNGEDVFNSAKYMDDLEEIRSAQTLAAYAEARGVTLGKRIADILTGLPAFIGEMAIGAKLARGVVGIGGRLIGRATVTAAEEAAAAAARQTIGQLSKKALLMGVGRTATVGIPRIAGGYAARTTPLVEIQNQTAAKVQGGEEPSVALLKSVGETYFMYTSLDFGPVLGRAAEGALKGGAQVVGLRKLYNALERAWMERTSGTASQFSKKMLEEGGFYGVVENIGAMRLNAVLNSVTGISGEPLGKALNPGADEFLAEFIAFLVPGAAKLTAGSPFIRALERQSDAAMKKAANEGVAQDMEALANNPEAKEWNRNQAQGLARKIRAGEEVEPSLVDRLLTETEKLKKKQKAAVSIDPKVVEQFAGDAEKAAADKAEPSPLMPVEDLLDQAKLQTQAEVARETGDRPVELDAAKPEVPAPPPRPPETPPPTPSLPPPPSPAAVPIPSISPEIQRSPVARFALAKGVFDALSAKRSAGESVPDEAIQQAGAQLSAAREALRLDAKAKQLSGDPDAPAVVAPNLLAESIATKDMNAPMAEKFRDNLKIAALGRKGGPSAAFVGKDIIALMNEDIPQRDLIPSQAERNRFDQRRNKRVKAPFLAIVLPWREGDLTPEDALARLEAFKSAKIARPEHGGVEFREAIEALNRFKNDRADQLSSIIRAERDKAKDEFSEALKVEGEKAHKEKVFDKEEIARGEEQLRDIDNKAGELRDEEAAAENRTANEIEAAEQEAEKRAAAEAQRKADIAARFSLEKGVSRQGHAERSVEANVEIGLARTMKEEARSRKRASTEEPKNQALAVALVAAANVLTGKMNVAEAKELSGMNKAFDALLKSAGWKKDAEPLLPTDPKVQELMVRAQAAAGAEHSRAAAENMSTEKRAEEEEMESPEDWQLRKQAEREASDRAFDQRHVRLRSWPGGLIEDIQKSLGIFVPEGTERAPRVEMLAEVLRPGVHNWQPLPVRMREFLVAAFGGGQKGRQLGKKFADWFEKMVYEPLGKSFVFEWDIRNEPDAIYLKDIIRLFRGTPRIASKSALEKIWTVLEPMAKNISKEEQPAAMRLFAATVACRDLIEEWAKGRGLKPGTYVALVRMLEGISEGNMAVNFKGRSAREILDEFFPDRQAQGISGVTPELAVETVTRLMESEAQDALRAAVGELEGIADPQQRQRRMAEIVSQAKGRPLAMGLTLWDLQESYNQLYSIVLTSLPIKESLDNHYELMKLVGHEMVRLGLIESEREFYYPHAILKYYEDWGSRWAGAPKKAVERFRAYTQARHGSELPFSLDYPATMVNLLTKYHMDNLLHALLVKVGMHYHDDAHVSKKGDMWKADDGWALYSMKRGLRGLKASTGFEQIMGGWLEFKAANEPTMDSGDPGFDAAWKAYHQSLVTKGEWVVIPKGIAARLDQFKDTPHRDMGKTLRAITAAWKISTIIQTLPSFTWNQLLGDPINAFREHAGSVAGIPAWLIKSLQFEFWGKETNISRELEEYGVYGSGWIMGETVNDPSGRLKHFYERTILQKLTAIPFRALSFIRQAGEAREGGVRSALYDDLAYTEGGREHLLKHYGKVIAALTDNAMVVARMRSLEAETVREGKKKRPKHSPEQLDAIRASLTAQAREEAIKKGAAKVAREQMVDYGGLPDWEQRNLRGLAFPFYAFFRYNAQNWFKYYLGRRTPEAIMKFILPYAAMQLWNRTGDRKEVWDNEPEYMRMMPQLILPGSQFQNGKPCILTFQTPSYEAENMVRQPVKALLRLASPVVRIPWGLIAMRDPMTGFKIHPADKLEYVSANLMPLKQKWEKAQRQEVEERRYGVSAPEGFWGTTLGRTFTLSAPWQGMTNEIDMAKAAQNKQYRVEAWRREIQDTITNIRSNLGRRSVEDQRSDIALIEKLQQKKIRPPETLGDMWDELVAMTHLVQEREFKRAFFRRLGTQE